MQIKKIKSILISVFHKDGLPPLLKILHKANAQFIATGGTQKFIEEQGYPVKPVETFTGYPSILEGRVKTLHPAIFGGILYRRNHNADVMQTDRYAIPPIDMVIVDLYPVEEAIKEQKTHAEIIEKIDIGGMSLIRAAAKNHQDVLAISSRNQYAKVLQLLQSKDCGSNIEDRKQFAALAFSVTAHYDKTIANYFDKVDTPYFLNTKVTGSTTLRYAENPHQKGTFYGNLSTLFHQLNGNKLSYNNLVDIDAAVRLINEFKENIAFAIIKHTNTCGVAHGISVKKAYQNALQVDPLSAFGGVLITNGQVDRLAAEAINKLFFDTLIAPDYTPEALTLLKSKKNRKILQQKQPVNPNIEFKSILNGVIEQTVDHITETQEHLHIVTTRTPSEQEKNALLFANKIVKHSKSNAIVLARDGQMLSSGIGQTSRVDALQQAIKKAKRFDLCLTDAVMASDAFFPFSDCVQIACNTGIKAIIQPGGSIKDQDSIDVCNQHGMAMAFTGFRHFKH